MALVLLGVLFVCCGLIKLHAVYGGLVTGEFIGKSEKYPVILATDPILFWTFMGVTIIIGIAALCIGARMVNEGLSTYRHANTKQDHDL